MKKTMSRLRSAAAGGVLLALVLGTGTVSAELLVHEPFDYERRQWMQGAEIPGEGIDGLDGGLGWAGAWGRIASDTLNAGIPEGEDDYGEDFGFRVEPLAYTDDRGNTLHTSGNQVRTSFGNRSWDRRLMEEAIGELGSTVWMSFLAQAHGLSTAHPRWAFIELSEWGTNRVWMGNVTPVSTGNWAMQIPDRFGGSVHQEAEDYPMNVHTLFLVKIEFPETSSGSTQFSVWLNPPHLNDEGALPEPVFDLDTNYSEYTHIGVAGRFSTDFDEIRIGTSFDSVTPAELAAPPVDLALDIFREGSDVVLSWPAAAEGYRLYSSDDLEEWTEVPQEPVVVGERNRVAVPAEHDRQFFRLQ